MDIVIHHNPKCGTSRNVLRLIRDAGYEPTIVPYLDTGWTRPQLQALFAAAGLTPREAMRHKRSPAEELGLTGPDVSDETILDAMVAHPTLVERPIVACKTGVRLCRPVGNVLDLLPNWPDGPWRKDNGAVLIDADGERQPE